MKIHTQQWPSPISEETASQPDIHGELLADMTGKSAYILHGLGEHSGRYERLVQLLLSLGYQVATHDHPGHGQSDGKRGVIKDADLYERVAAEQIERFSIETDSVPVLFGHSLGGVVAANLVLSERVNVSGLILSAPAFSPIISKTNSLKLAALQLIAPQFRQQLPYVASRLTHDKTAQQEGSTDPLNHQYKSASLINWLINAGAHAFTRADQLKIRTLLLVAGEDMVVDSAVSHQFASKAPSEFITICTYPDYYHEILNETAERREAVHKDIERWLVNKHDML